MTEIVHEDDEVTEAEPEVTDAIDTADMTPVRVKILHREEQAALVQWVDDDGNTGRVIIPTDEIASGKVPLSTLHAGIPGAEPWREIDGISADLEQAFYRRGIWEPEDLLKSSHLARGAIQQALVVPLMKALLEHAKRAKRSQ